VPPARRDPRLLRGALTRRAARGLLTQRQGSRDPKGASRNKASGRRPGRGYEEGALLDGPRVIEEVLAAGRRRVLEAYVRSSDRRGARLREIVRCLEDSGARVEEVGLREFTRRFPWARSQIVARAEPLRVLSFAALASLEPGPESGPLLAIDSVEDPRNLGALLRAAACFGVKGAVICEERAAGLLPGTLRAAAGATEVLDIYRVRGFAKALRALAEGRWRVLGLTLPGEAEYGRYVDGLMDPWSVVLAVGAELRGLRQTARRACEALLHLDQERFPSSLNVASAASAALYQLRRRMETVGGGAQPRV
jgi:23S rRNA (guanosine2251-2'-O)-methyltransferase